MPLELWTGESESYSWLMGRGEQEQDGRVLLMQGSPRTDKWEQ